MRESVDHHIHLLLLDVNILRNFLMKKEEDEKIDEASGFTDKNVPREVETAFMTGLE